VFFILFFTGCCVHAQSNLPAIGEWREHLPYNSAIDVSAGNNRIYCATPYSLFSVSASGDNIERFSRINGLNETGVSCIRFDENGNKLVIAYSNSNIDVLKGNSVFNIPDIKRDNIAGDKSIYNIYVLGNNYYLSTGLGVIVIDAARYEVKDSWFIGTGGTHIKVNAFSSDAGYFYAATTEGLKRIAKTSTNPSDAANWQLLSGTNGLPAGPLQNVLNVQEKIIVQKNDSLLLWNGSSWSLFYTDGWPFVNVEVTEQKITVCERQVTGASRVLILDSGGSVSRTISNTGAVSFPRKTILHNNIPWVADQYACLSRIDNGNAYTNFSLNSPQGPASGEMTVFNGSFFATAGSVNSSWNYQYNGDGIFILKEGVWTNINRYRFPVLDSMYDFIAVAVDRRDESVWAGSFGGGLLHVLPSGAFQIYKQNFLSPAIGDPGSYRVSGLYFDEANNLWISNFGAAQPLKVRKQDGSWRSFSLPFTVFENALSQVIVDGSNYKWIVAPLGNGLICFDDGGSIDNNADDRWKRYTRGTGNGNLPGTDVLCIAGDKSGFIWVGTDDGIGVIECPWDAFSAKGCDAVWPVVPNGNFAGYLFKGQEVNSIAVDGADRKWVATRNGVFLVGSSGEELIYHFTENNSPLFSNDVKKITIDGKSGEVFFATSKGICSFRSTATEAQEENGNVLVFPNPVPPGFTGTIAVRGLPGNAIVKITELNGRLLTQGRALGGQFIWNGRNYLGQRISSGAYLVIISGEDKKEQVVSKIFFISR
jgi:hypothetical protein